MKHYTITIKVAFDKDTIPEDMGIQLRLNVARCVERNGLFDDPRLMSIVEDWKATVEENQ